MMKLSKAQASSSPSLLVRVYWGDILYDTVLCEPGESITVGREPGSTFVMELGRGSTVSKLPLLKVGADNVAELSFDGKMEGHIRAGGKLATLDKLRTSKAVLQNQEGLYSSRITSADTASIVIGYVSFDISWSKGRSHVPRPVVLDTRGAAFTGAVAASMLVLITLFTVPEVAPPEEEKPPERIVEIVPPKILRPKPVEAVDSAPPAAAAPAPSQAQQEAPKPPTAAETLKSADLGSLVNNLSNIGANAAAPAVKTNSAVAADTPTQTFSANAVAASGPAKATIGKTQGAGEGGLAGTDQLGLGSNSGLAGGTGTVLGAPAGESGAGLDRQVIDQIVRRRQDRIRMCYERQLNFVPGLAGKVTVQFLIDGKGSVIRNTIIEDTMKNKAVNDCITSEVKAWTFPAPKGGAEVKVDYPFVFESGGTNF